MQKRKRALAKEKFDCTLDPQAAERNFCRPEQCSYCGWGREERARREAYTEEYGLTLCADGLRRLVMKEKDGKGEE